MHLSMVGCAGEEKRSWTCSCSTQTRSSSRRVSPHSTPLTKVRLSSHHCDLSSTQVLTAPLVHVCPQVSALLSKMRQSWSLTLRTSWRRSPPVSVWPLAHYWTISRFWCADLSNTGYPKAPFFRASMADTHGDRVTPLEITLKPPTSLQVEHCETLCPYLNSCVDVCAPTSDQ